MDHESMAGACEARTTRIHPHNWLNCKIWSRPKGYIRLFGISRIQFREMASKGLIPGVTKASW